MFLKNKNIIFKIRRSKITDYAALTSNSLIVCLYFAKIICPDVICLNTMLTAIRQIGNLADSKNPSKIQKNLTFHWQSQVTSDICLRTVEIQMRRLLIRIFTVT